MRLADLKRHLGYLFWVVGEQTALIGVPRFILFPIGAYAVGKADFGLFITAYSVAAMVGETPAHGIAIGVLREMKNLGADRELQLCRTAMDLCHRVLLVVLAFGMVAIVVTGVLRITSLMLVLCLAALALSLYPQNQVMVALTELRFHRRFRDRTIWFGIQALCATVCGLTGAATGSPVGLAVGFAVGHMVAFLLLRRRRSSWRLVEFDREIATTLKSVWLHMSIASVLAFSGLYLNRILLSAWYSFVDVSDLYAATATMALFSAPMLAVSTLLVSMLSAHASFAALPRRAKVQCLLLSVASILALPIALKVIGPFVLRMMYPRFGDGGVQLLDIVVWAMPLHVLMLVTRPFVVRFARAQVMPVVNGLGLAGHLAPVLVLVPALGARGAAWSLVIGHGVQSLALIMVPLYFVYRRSARPDGTEA